MNDFDRYYTDVIHKISNSLLLQQWPNCRSILLKKEEDIISFHWEIDLIFNASIAAGGNAENAVPVAAACLALDEAIHLIDQVQDEFCPAEARTETENLSFALVLAACDFLSDVQAQYVKQVLRTFSAPCFGIFLGQNKGLELTKDMPLDTALELYWNSTILKSGGFFKMFTAGSAAAVTSNPETIMALGGYGMALGTILQILDDCRDVLDGEGRYEISLPILLYSQAMESQTIVFPDAKSGKELPEILKQAGVIEKTADVLLSWQQRGLASLATLNASDAVEQLMCVLWNTIKTNAFSVETMQV